MSPVGIRYSSGITAGSQYCDNKEKNWVNKVAADNLGPLPEPIITKNIPHNLGSHEICAKNYPITLKFDRCLHSTCSRDACQISKPHDTNLTALRLHTRSYDMTLIRNCNRPGGLFQYEDHIFRYRSLHYTTQSS